ncbi:phosphatase PAP2 family protein [Aliivibrio fischeri]|uniref:phosphatase PAP2 family protein n=1 Tax=Aliivibrio fischeri TaxID=668 RepID=UPI0007C4765A|nr:phosphatase PAP2 family protein [Aliivibrio fischeri]
MTLDINVIKQGKKGVYRDRWVYLLCSILTLTISFIAYLFGQSNHINLLAYFNKFLLAAALTLLIYSISYFIYLICRLHPRPISQYLNKIRSIQLEEIIRTLTMIFFLSLALSSYTTLKSLIPLIHPYTSGIDNELLLLDKWLHFGIDPWRITHYLFRSAEATAFINFMYNLWFFIVWIIAFYFLISVKNEKLRTQYLLSFVLCWIINGGFIAVGLSSVGPCFYHLIENGNHYFSPLMDLLNEQNQQLIEKNYSVTVWALKTQTTLWESYLKGGFHLGSGISACPSMHVSMATLMAIGMTKKNKWWGFVFWPYCLIIMIGSVHLGWHYALDGYLSLILTTIIWKSVKIFILKQRNEEFN